MDCFKQFDEARFIIKVADRVYRGYQQYGSRTKDFDNIADCLVTMLQVHADRETNRNEEQAP